MFQQLPQTSQENMHRLDMAVMGRNGDTWLAASGAFASGTCRNLLMGCWILDRCTPKCRPTSAPDVPAISISNTLSLSFPFRRGIVAFVNVEKLTSGFLWPRPRYHETDKKCPKNSSKSRERREVIFFLNMAANDVMKICGRQILCSVKTQMGTGVNVPTKPVTITICKKHQHFKLLH